MTQYFPNLTLLQLDQFAQPRNNNVMLNIQYKYEGYIKLLQSQNCPLYTTDHRT